MLPDTELLQSLNIGPQVHSEESGYDMENECLLVVVIFVRDVMETGCAIARSRLPAGYQQ